jgi:hypothetical protein
MVQFYIFVSHFFLFIKVTLASERMVVHLLRFISLVITSKKHLQISNVLLLPAMAVLQDIIAESASTFLHCDLSKFRKMLKKYRIKIVNHVT